VLLFSGVELSLCFSRISIFGGEDAFLCVPFFAWTENVSRASETRLTRRRYAPCPQIVFLL